MSRSDAPIALAPSAVIGYHGCAETTAEALLSGDAFLRSSNSYDWLGVGVYFWEYGPYRAWEWAQAHFDRPAVLEGRIRLGRCLNLLDIGSQGGFALAYLQAVEEAAAHGAELPRNDLRRKLHRRDRFMVEFYCRLVASEGAKPYQTVRACFPEGEPIFEGSAILAGTHVQVAVRDAACISRLRRVSLP